MEEIEDFSSVSMAEKRFLSAVSCDYLLFITGRGESDQFIRSDIFEIYR